MSTPQCSPCTATRINKRKHELYELHINEQEAEIVRLIFDKYVYEGYGAQRIATYLNNADLYDSASFESKKMIVSQLIRRVEVYRGYQIHVDFNFDLAQYLENSDELAC